MNPVIYSQRMGAEHVDCAREKCVHGNCELKLPGFPREKVILDVDCIVASSESGRRCDYVIVVDDGNAVFLLPVEFKSTKLDFTKIGEQLEGGVKFFKEHLPGEVGYFPVLVSTKLDRHSRNKLTKIRIKLGGKPKRIKHVLCNKGLRWSEVRKKA